MSDETTVLWSGQTAGGMDVRFDGAQWQFLDVEGTWRPWHDQPNSVANNAMAHLARQLRDLRGAALAERSARVRREETARNLVKAEVLMNRSGGSVRETDAANVALARDSEALDELRAAEAHLAALLEAP